MFTTFHVQIFPVFFSQIEKQLVNEVIYEKKLGGGRPFKDSKLQVKLIQPVSSPTYIPLLARALDVWRAVTLQPQFRAQ